MEKVVVLKNQPPDVKKMTPRDLILTDSKGYVMAFDNYKSAWDYCHDNDVDGQVVMLSEPESR